MHRLTRISISIALIAATGLTGCLFSPEKAKPDPDPPPEPAVYHERTSPDSVLMNLEIAHLFKDIDGYADQIDDAYEFIPSQEDINTGEITFESLNQEQDYLSTENMFDVVFGIEIRLDQSPVYPSDREDFPEDEGYMMIQVPSAYLAVETPDAEGGEPVTYLVQGDPALFIFKPDTTVAPTTWQIVYQEDQHQ